MGELLLVPERMLEPDGNILDEICQLVTIAHREGLLRSGRGILKLLYLGPPAMWNEVGEDPSSQGGAKVTSRRITQMKSQHVDIPRRQRIHK